ncbi:hypothetical protein [Rufibacter hautae]|uniref:HNH domain-containing protein n=1 Tax=Rufibacter hautae TaxID=2595005 RepID=A0A5B6TAY7_9BACT|nr:hypothetical protein [Rufibacter hautae]KAA3436740.1 hypothetical protein FOA19_20390 [Rufibacter hautae]
MQVLLEVKDYHNINTSVTDLQKDFLRLYSICGLKYGNISKELNVSRQTLSQWYEDLKPERERIAKIRAVWSRKKFTPVFEDFYTWYQNLERKCHYCDITEDEIAELLDSGKLNTKRIVTRGRRLEYDRKVPDLLYENIENVVLCCYWCNNAKTDTFTYDEFKEIGKVFKAIWKERMAR